MIAQGGEEHIMIYMFLGFYSLIPNKDNIMAWTTIIASMAYNDLQICIDYEIVEFVCILEHRLGWVLSWQVIKTILLSIKKKLNKEAWR